MAKRRGKKRGKKQAVALLPADLAAVLAKAPAGEGLTVEHVRADAAAGAPVNAAGEIDLVGYTAWLLRRHGYPDRSVPQGGA